MIIFHTLCGLTALVSGLVVIFLRKGHQQHRIWGFVYLASMLTLCITSFTIYEFFGNFGAFHVLAMVSLVSITGGWISIRIFKRDEKTSSLKGHYMFMLFSYVGLVMATGSHFFGYVYPFMLARGFSNTFIFAVCASSFWILPYLIGSILIYRNWPRFARRFEQVPVQSN